MRNRNYSNKMTVLKCVLLFACMGALFASASTKAKNDKIDGPVIGIDLGTTYSAVGIYKNGRVEVIPNDLGNRITPSQVAFTETGEILVGEAAKNQASQNPLNTIYVVKRLIGRNFSDKEVQKDIKKLPYKIVNVDGKPYVQVSTNEGDTKNYSPE